MTLRMPEHFGDRPADLWVERTARLAEAAPTWARSHGVRPAAEDRWRVCAFGIDAQITFCHPEGGLYVPGAEADTTRAARFVYANLDRLTSLVFSLDTHELMQIFHPAFWRDADGQPPAPFTPIPAAEVRAGKWTPRRARDACLEYVERLETSDRQYVLTIWPYHGLLGGVSHALMPELTEAALFHGFARDTAASYVIKGRQPLTEMYSVLAPEVTSLRGEVLGGFDEELFQTLMSHDEVYVFGQASSHCVLATLEDLRDRILQVDPALMSRVVLLEDAMSPVQPPPLDPLPPELDFPAVAKRRLAALLEGGMRSARTTDRVGARPWG